MSDAWEAAERRVEELTAELDELRPKLRGAVMERNALQRELDALRNKYAAVEKNPEGNA